MKELNPAFSRDALSPKHAVGLLSEDLSHPFDRGLRTLAAKAFDSALEIIPTR